MKPVVLSVLSEMLRMFSVFLPIESTAETSLLSIYSISGLLNESESEVDIVSSIETDNPSDLLGETFMMLERATSDFCGAEATLGKSMAFGFESKLLGTGTVKAESVGGASSLCVNELALGKTTAFGLVFKEVGSLFVLAILVAPCTLQDKNPAFY